MDLFLPVKTKYAILIANGKKTVEFRRNIWKESVDRIILYASGSIKKVIAIITEWEVVYLPISLLWERYEKRGGITRIDFGNYFINKSYGYGIVINKIKKITPVNPHDKIMAFNVPQNFCYIEEIEWEK